MSGVGDVVRSDATAAELLDAIERHQTEMSVKWTVVQDGVVVEGPGFVRTINPGVKVAFANNVHILGLASAASILIGIVLLVLTLLQLRLSYHGKN